MEWWMYLLILYAVGCSILCGVFGFIDEDLNDIWGFVVFWPVVLSILIIIAPFYGVWKCGQHLAKSMSERRRIRRTFIENMKHLFSKLDLRDDDERF